MSGIPLVESTLPLELIRRGKVREVYAVDAETILLVASDRISAFDVVLNEAIPHKGAVLTQISAYWFRELADITASHFITADAAEIIHRVPQLAGREAAITGRAMLGRRTTPVSFECVVRGYLAGSAWKEYKAQGTLAGEKLAPHLRESERFDPPIFSPATKADFGHDENVTYGTLIEALGEPLARQLRSTSLDMYRAGRNRAAERGIIIADTKFEFGHTSDGELLLIDEVLTPDSSRFWPADVYEPGRGQTSFDKQPMRDYLDELRRGSEWDGEAPPPAISNDIVRATSQRYRDAYERITGQPLPIP